MRKEVLVWGRKLELDIVYDAYEGEEILPSQINALDDFLENANELLDNPQAVIDYCLNQNPNEIDVPVDNVFRFVVPTSIFVKRENDKKVVVLLCDYKYDVEHGIAIIYENNELKEICSQSNI